MARTDEWSLGHWPGGSTYLDDDLGRRLERPSVLEEIRIVAALVGLACLAILLV